MSPGSMMPALVSGEQPSSRLDTLPPWPWWDDPFHPDAPLTLGWHAIGWAENVLIQPNGPKAGHPFRFTPRQLRFLLWWYALDEDGRWLFNHGARRLAKGSGKSPFAAVVCLIEFCGPARLDRKDDRMPGRVRAKPVDMPWIQITATAESQTKNTMRMVRAFAPKGSRIVDEYQLDVGKTIYYKVPEGTLEVTTSSATAVEGAETTLVVGDETEHWKPGHHGDDLAETHEDNLAKSGSRMLETSNAWVPGAESVAEKTWDAWLAQEEGRLRSDAGRILYDAVVAPPDTDLADYDSLRSALEFVYADCPWVDIPTVIRRIWSPKMSPSEAKRKYLNWPSVAEDAWVAPEEWALLEAEPSDGPISDGDDVALFFDGSKSRDATALVGCRISDGHVFTLGVWEPDPAHDTAETVDASDVDRVVRRAFDRFSVSAFFADVKEWESWALTTWPGRYADELAVWAQPAARPPQAIAWDMRAHKYDFAKAVEACHAEIIDGAFTHDGDSRVARHVANARRRPYRDLVSVSKESPDSPRKIDAAVCVIGARMVRRIVLGTREKKTGKRPGRVW